MRDIYTKDELVEGFIEAGLSMDDFSKVVSSIPDISDAAKKCGKVQYLIDKSHERYAYLRKILEGWNEFFFLSMNEGACQKISKQLDDMP